MVIAEASPLSLKWRGCLHTGVFTESGNTEREALRTPPNFLVVRQQAVRRAVVTCPGSGIWPQLSLNQAKGEGFPEHLLHARHCAKALSFTTIFNYDKVNSCFGAHETEAAPVAGPTSQI